ncbi:MAG: glycoside hydrolase family 2 TIM barrel-domain containing protein [Candidatus Bathyarchaeia archaeon]
MMFDVELSREMVDLSGFWHFKIDPVKKGEDEKWFEQASFSRWDKIYVPASWNEQSSEYTWYMGTAWYARTFNVPLSWSDKLVFVGFEGVNYRAKVWVNGIFVGEHEGGFTPFAFRMENVLKFGERNTVVVMVDDTLTKKTVPPGEGMNQTYFDFFHYGGIHREVYVLAVSKIHIKDVWVRTNIKDSDGILDIDIEAVSEYDKERFCKVTLKIFDENDLVAESRVSYMATPHTSKTLYQKIILKSAKFWSPESPHLYTLRVSILYEDKEIDRKEIRFGIRTVKVENGKILLNGRPIFLKGCARHEDFPVLGKAVHGAVLRKDFGLMKEIGCNSFRTSHYPYSRSHLNLADEYGFLVILEMPTCGFRRAIEKFDDPEIVEKIKRMTREAIIRDRNHPSVIMYSLFNEPDSGYEDFRTLLKEVKEDAKKTDSTRPITFVTDKHLSDICLDLADVLCHNFYFGWYTLSGDLVAAEKKLSEILDEIHKKFPDKPIIVTEFGADAIDGIHKDPPEMWSEEYQAELIKTYWKVFLSKDYVVGGHIWNFADFRVGQSTRRTTLNRKGIFTRTRDPKSAVKTVKELFMGTPTYR